MFKVRFLVHAMKMARAYVFKRLNLLFLGATITGFIWHTPALFPKGDFECIEVQLNKLNGPLYKIKDEADSFSYTFHCPSTNP